MASPPRTAEREEERRLNMRTLVVASVASATAAVLTSQLWIAGTWIAAAMTPVVVTLVSELLHRPTERIARSISTSRAEVPRRPDRIALPEAGGAAPPARPDADPLPKRVPDEPAAPVRFYRTGEAEPRPGGPGRPRTRRRKIAYGAVLATAGLAFLIAIVALTVPELVTGGSIGKNDGRTTLFSGGKDNEKDNGASDQQKQPETTTDEQQPDQQQEQQPAPSEEQSTTPSDQTTTEEPPPTTETPPGEPAPQTPAAPDAQP